MRIARFLPGFSLLAAASLPLGAAEYQGADALLKRLTAPRAEAQVQKPADLRAQARQKVAAFQKQAGTLPPGEAARQWVALFDAYGAASSNEQPANSNSVLIRTEHLFGALPPGNSWNEIARMLEESVGEKRALREDVLRLLAATLRGDLARRREALEAVSKTVDRTPELPWKEIFRARIDTIADLHATESGDAAQRLAIFEKKIATWEKDKDRSTGDLQIPPLLTFAPKDKAAALLRRILLKDGENAIEHGPTRRLAAEVALQNVSKLAGPPWGLIQELGDVPLYEALAKRFPQTDENLGFQRERAERIYLVNLIVKNRVKEAAQFIANSRFDNSLLTDEMTNQLVSKGLIKQVHGVLRELLQKDPALPFWPDFVELSAQQGESDGALALIREIAARPNLPKEARATVQKELVNALLAADQVDDAIALLRDDIKKGPAKQSQEEVLIEVKARYGKAGVRLSPEMLAQFARRYAEGSASGGYDEHLRRCQRLMTLGQLLERPEIYEEALKASREALANAPAEDRMDAETIRVIGKDLVAAGRGAEAEEIVSDALVRCAKAENSQQLWRENHALLTQLAFIYQRADRAADVVRLLDAAPQWNVSDLAELEDAHHSDPLLYSVAKAFAALGRKEEARRVVERLIEARPDYDPGYRLLLDLGGDGLEAWLDAALQRDRFEERPLIWKARLQLDAGRVDEAEKTIRAAIAIDPSDGEQGKDDRMRAYAVLGEILEKKGDAAQAKIMRGAVESVRLSENADDWWSAGLLTRAVKIYEEALGHFADAYCIQSRLALRYSELGDFAKAEQHYQRAYELMPESFGRIESHCFGCESAFSGVRAQGIAERVFTQLAARMPDKPQVFYLLGYLRSGQERAREAAMEYRKAVKLDPDYFNAWEKLYDLAESANLPPAEVQEAVLAMLRLDPGRKRFTGGFDKVHDLRALWDATLAAEKESPAPSTAPLYPLAAAKAKHLKAAQVRQMAQGRAPGIDDPAEAMSSMLSRTRSLRADFVAHPLLQAIGDMVDTILMQR